MIVTKKRNTLEYQCSDSICVPHCFTTRYGGVSTGVNESMNLALNSKDTPENVRQNLQILARELGFDLSKLVMTRQIHSDIVRIVTAADAAGPFHRDYPQCDGLVTCEPGVALLVFTADCTPIVLHDPVTGAVGAAHAGWRGTAQKIGQKCVQAMVQHFGSRPEDIRAAIGPNIAQCHFETDGDVPAAMLATYGDAAAAHIQTRGQKFHLDLKTINALSLREAGVRHIDISDGCTYCENERYWSHRYTKGERGSQGAIIVCKGGRQ